MHTEKLHGFDDGKVICGVDEVGRGPLAGPVVACAAILPAGGLPEDVALQIKDSKQLSEKKREALFSVLTEMCRYGLGEANVAEIDAINILEASMLAMRRAVEGLGVIVDRVLVDGNRVPQLSCPATAIVKGDSTCLSIAVASIIAKVTRDRFMKKLAEAHPGYGWDKNAGYGTAAHLAALRTLGPTVWHRRSFAPVAKA